MTVLFVVLFSIGYLAIYRPFAASDAFWLSASDPGAAPATVLFYIVSVSWLALTKAALHLKDRKRSVSMRDVVLCFATDFVGTSVIYLAFTLFLGFADMASVPELLVRSLACVALIVGIPSFFSLQYAIIQDKKEEIEVLKLNTTSKEMQSGLKLINLYDYSGILRITAVPEDIFYVESQDNYVSIHYTVDGQMTQYLLRNTTVGIEDAFRGTVIVRCHRSFMVNIAHIKVMKHEKGRATVIMDDKVGTVIPVSRTYYSDIMGILTQYRAA